MKYRIPLFDLSYDEQEEKAIVETLRSRWISTGPKCQELELLFCDNLGLSNALKVWRARRDITQGQLANAVGLSRQTIHSIEKGRAI